MKQLLALVFAAFLMAACQSSSENSGTTTTAPSDTATPSEQINADSEKPTVNPAHGQPYHDCSIPVGAPLAAN